MPAPMARMLRSRGSGSMSSWKCAWPGACVPPADGPPTRLSFRAVQEARCDVLPAGRALRVRSHRRTGRGRGRLVRGGRRLAPPPPGPARGGAAPFLATAARAASPLAGSLRARPGAPRRERADRHSPRLRRHPPALSLRRRCPRVAPGADPPRGVQDPGRRPDPPPRVRGGRPRVAGRRGAHRLLHEPARARGHPRAAPGPRRGPGGALAPDRGASARARHPQPGSGGSIAVPRPPRRCLEAGRPPRRCCVRGPPREDPPVPPPAPRPPIGARRARGRHQHHVSTDAHAPAARAPAPARQAAPPPVHRHARRGGAGSRGRRHPQSHGRAALRAEHRFSSSRTWSTPRRRWAAPTSKGSSRRGDPRSRRAPAAAS